MTATTQTRREKRSRLEPFAQGYESASKYIYRNGSQEELSVSLLFQTSIRLQKTFDRYFVQFRMTAQEAAVLIRCVEAGEISARRLADMMSRDKGKITRFVDRLEAGSFLSRNSDPRDHRSLVIKATHRGRRVAPRLKAMFEEIRKQVFAGVLTSDIDQLETILSRLSANADSLYRDKVVRDRPRDKTHARRGRPARSGN